MHDPVLHIALYHPEIPPNTGNAGRLCVGTGSMLHVVHPIAFQMDEKAVRRAGLDYWRHVSLMEHENEEAFWQWVGERNVHLFSARGALPLHKARFERGDVLLFGRETVGLPDELIDRRGAIHIPMADGPIRSLNLSNAISIVAYTAIAQIQPAWWPR